MSLGLADCRWSCLRQPRGLSKLSAPQAGRSTKPVTLQWSAPASQQMCLPAQALLQAMVLSLLSCRDASGLHPLHLTTLCLQILLRQLCREQRPLHLLKLETLLGQETLLLPQLQR